ncbi:cobyrinate a,c-diamide synthase [Tepidibacter formicigenes]|jgi:cobyrinic acid a,c-diamide synthase|uniref:Cobyrinate a,c-diamide synthase n=1 Tax=Tepidibacter formicigenes DSM 15518 TaxID=1123349 RepID=A0A1M6RI01_9FIRM|nr:cobyrinate a,c-diamide synthase [Tepidibacter formicigenes]SHK32141.1 cobyrinic acid a,c-diamide synthase [Tepidibacter formicigenes DSM 15518]
MKKILISGTNSGAGKTTISMGIMAALKKRGLKVQPYKVGPDYIDTSYHTFITGKKSRNLDSYMLDDEIIKYLFMKNSREIDISVIEGVMGLYDGYGIDINSCTSSYTSKILKVPVVLVIDGKSMATSAAAMVLGYKELDKNVDIKGVIVNNISSKGHFEIIKEAIEKYTNTKVLGYLPKNLQFSLPSRHLGLIPTIEMEKLEENFLNLADIIEEYINLDELLKISESESLTSNYNIKIPKYDNLTIAMAYDKAFNFYYWDSIDLLKEMGVNIVKFSPIKDKCLPKCHGIYIGGGFPELFAKELETNKSIRGEIKKAHEKNIPIYAECGGLMYLGEKLIDNENNEYEMVGILKGKSIMTKSLKRFGYSKGIAIVDTVISKKGEIVLGHEFHHSEFISDEKCAYNIVKEREGKIIKEWMGGYIKGNTLATYLHTHFYSNLNIPINFLNKAVENI